MTTTINASTSSGLVNTADTSGILQLQTASTAAVTIDGSQQVGVGTASPASLLHVAGNIRTSSGANYAQFANNFLRSNASGSFFYDNATVGQSNEFRTSVSSSLDTTALTLTASGILALRNAATNATGIGITFPATQSASSNANTLDDYEEGTWTPGFAPASGSITYTSVGTYVKVGKAVTVYWSVTITGGTAPSGAGTVSNFPFTTNDSGGAGANRAAIGLVREDAATGVAYFFYLNASATSGIVNTLTNGGLVWTNGYTYDGMVTYIASA